MIDKINQLLQEVEALKAANAASNSLVKKVQSTT